jgi:DNA-binding CsgD family transcriptional regulator/tetratricopeptide (TPR) repeat protein
MGAAVPGPVSPVLIGRDDLLALADRRLASAADGSGELLFFAGEAGIGKSRLLLEVARRAREAGFAVVGAGASPGDAEVAAGLLIDLAAELRREPATADLGAGIVERLHVSGSERPRPSSGGDAEHQRRQLIADLTDLIEALADRPTLITLEDLHWADDLTLDVLGRVGRRVRALPMLVIGTYRSDELYPRVPMRAWRSRLLTQRHAEEARLGRLTRDDTAAMALAITGTVLPADVTGTVFARSDGIPLHVEEFLATVAEVPETLADAVLIRADQLTPQARALAGAASVLGRSFDVDLLTAITGDGHAMIDDGLRELADRFFVQPRPDRSTYDFRHALIRDALYADLAPHRRRALHARAAEAAVAAGFADAFVSDQYERARRPEVAHGYALTAARDAAVMSAHREAVELYRRALRTMPATAPPAGRAGVLAALAAELAAIDDNAAAAEAYQAAYRLRLELGDRLAAAALVPAWVAVRHLLGAGLDERVTALRAAVALIDGGGESSAASGVAGADVDVVRAGLRAALAAAYMLDRRLAEAIEDGELARSIPAADRDREMSCNLDATVGSVLLFAGRMDEGWRLLEDATARAAEWRFEAQAARGYRMLGSSASVLVEYPRAQRWLRDGIAYAERVERFNDRHYMTAHLGHVRWATGDWDGAVAAAEHALADGRGGITTRITALHALGYVAMGRGGPTGFLAEAADLGAEMRELQRVSPAWWGLAEAALRAGDPDDAIRWCEKGYEASARVRDAAYLFPYVVTGTRAHLARHEPTGARAWLARTSDLLLERRIPGTLGAIDHAWGLIHLHEGQTGKARTCLAHAADFWSSRQRFWEGTAALMDQSRCATRSRRPADAAMFLARAREAYAAVGAVTPGLEYFVAPPGRVVSSSRPGRPGVTGSRTYPASEASPTSPAGVMASRINPAPDIAPVGSPTAASSAARVLAAPPELSSGGAGLSAREMEVARLVATGATNREIAAALSIAPKTVAAHVEHILTKLGVSRRAQIAAWAAIHS